MNLTARRGAIVLASLTLGLLGLAAPANAATSADSPPSAKVTTSAVSPSAASDCPAYYACLWAQTSYRGSRWQGQNSNSSLPSWIDHNSKSAVNHGQNCYVNWWSGTSYTGSELTFGFNVAIDDLSVLGWSNKIRSMNWC